MAGFAVCSFNCLRSSGTVRPPGRPTIATAMPWPLPLLFSTRTVSRTESPSVTSVFASFVGTHDATLKTIAFGLGVGVLVDAFVVRMTLVPAALALLGHKSWWLPRRLDRAGELGRSPLPRTIAGIASAPKAIKRGAR